MNRDKAFGYRSTREWRQLAPAAVFFVVMAVVAIVANLLFVAVFLTVTAPVIGFVTGYIMRADEVATGRRPHLPFLYVEGDEGHG